MSLSCFSDAVSRSLKIVFGVLGIPSVYDIHVALSLLHG